MLDNGRGTDSVTCELFRLACSSSNSKLHSNFHTADQFKRRRDAAKTAQRKFRQREATKAEALKRKHERLQCLLGEIVAAYGADDEGRLASRIAQTCHELGIKDVPRASSRLKHDESAAITSNHGAPVSSELPNHQSRVPLRMNKRISNPNSRSARSNPALNYAVLGIDTDRFDKIFDAPMDILPYVGHGEYTVAGQITWACLECAYERLKEDPGQKEHVERTMAHSPELSDVSYMMSLLEARLEFRRLGFMRRGVPTRPHNSQSTINTSNSTRDGTDESMRQLIESRVLHGLASRGVLLGEWWSALEIEEYVQARMGTDCFSAFQASLRKEAVANMTARVDTIQKKETATALLKPLVSSLVDRAVCFGDGPRWHGTRAMALANAWATEIDGFSLLE